MAGADGNTGGTDSSGTSGLATGGTGQVADPGLNPTGSKVEGNDASKINEATGAKGLVHEGDDPAGLDLSDVVKENGQDPETVIEKMNAEKAKQASLKIEGDGDYDAASGIIRSGEVTLTGEDGVTVTKRAG